MRHIAGFLAISASLAFAGCSSVPGSTPSPVVGAVEQASSALITKITDDPSAPFCVANSANRNFRKTGLAKGGAAAANQTVGAITYFGCLALGGQPTATAPRTASPAAPVAPAA